jgi:tight adherence protein B
MAAIAIGVLTFVTMTGIVVTIWWWVSASAALRARLANEDPTDASGPLPLRQVAEERFVMLSRLAGIVRADRYLARLVAQAGLPGRTGEAVACVLASALVGGVVGGLRMGSVLWILVGSALGAWLPVVFLQRRRHQRLEKFSEQFPDALDMMTRALQAGYAIGGALQVVAEEMPDPMGMEFRQVFQQVALGGPVDEALKALHERIELEDLQLFRVAVGIQREVGGNLAEIFRSLSQVIRDRFRVLSYARVLSAQHRLSAYCVAASPLAMAIMFALMDPGFFSPLLEHPFGGALIGGAILMQIIGFVALKRIATITV